MDPEILVFIQSKYAELQQSIGEGLLIMHEPGFEIKHAYHVGHRIDMGKKSMFAQVRVCTHRETGVRRAVKSYYLGDSQESGVDIVFPKRPGLKLSGILNEIKMQSQLSHQYVCKLHEVFMQACFIHLVMDLCRGGEIYDYLAANKKFSPEEAFPIFLQTLEAVKYMHGLNITHRTICIENILFYDKERTRIKIISFSSAAEGILFTEKYGCALYMAPEMFADRYGIKCDVWSLGVCFYAMITGFQPFQGKNTAEIVKKSTSTNLPKDQAWSKLPKKMKKFVKSMLVPEIRRPAASNLLESELLVEYAQKLPDIVFGKFIRALKQPKPAEEFMIKVQFSNRIKALTVKILNQAGAIPDMEYIEVIWNGLDTQREGKISFQLLDSFLQNQCRGNSQMISKFLDILKRYNTAQNLFVAKESFMSTIITISDKALILQAFGVLDENKDGTIQPIEFCRFNYANYEEFELLFTEAMGKNDITKEEFCSLITKFSS